MKTTAAVLEGISKRNRTDDFHRGCNVGHGVNHS